MAEGRTIVKKVDNAVLYSDDTILVKGVRLSYPHLVKPYKEGGKYSAVFLMPKTEEYEPARKLIFGEVARMIRDNLANKKNPNPDIPAANKFIRDGDLRTDKPEFMGNWTINASESFVPILRGRERDPKTGKACAVEVQEATRVFYPGCWVNVLIKPWFQNHEEYGKKVNAGLIAVQFFADDEPFGTGRISDEIVDDTFDPIDDDDSGFDDDDEESL